MGSFGDRLRAWLLSRRVISAAAVVLVVAAVTGVYLLTRQPSAPTRLVLPPPSAARTVYTNSAYRYTFTYPSDWTLSASRDGKAVHVFLAASLSLPEDEALDILVYPNPQQLSPEEWWHANLPRGSPETGIGPQALKSGVPVYVSERLAQSQLKIYTLADSSAIIQIVRFETGSNYDEIIAEAVNSFTLT